MLVLVISTLVIKGLWNTVARDINFLPILKFKHALALSCLIGLGTLLILTMIAGIREILTPEAWKRQGSSYQLNSPAMESDRRRAIEHLRSALMDYADKHEGIFPRHDFTREIPERIWETIDPKGSRFRYVGELTSKGPLSLLAFEPNHFGDHRFAVLTDGSIRKFLTSELEQLNNAPTP